MNAKKAKKLRRILETIVETKQAGGQKVEQASYVEDTRKRKFIKVAKHEPINTVPTTVTVDAESAIEQRFHTDLAGKHDGDTPTGITYEQRQIAPGMIKLDNTSVKGAYRALKKGVAEAMRKDPASVKRQIAAAEESYGVTK